MIKGCESALVWKEQKSRYQVETFKVANDKAADDFSPVWADRKNSTIMFTSDREGGADKAVYARNTAIPYRCMDCQQKAQREEKSDKWEAPVLVEELKYRL